MSHRKRRAPDDTAQVPAPLYFDVLPEDLMNLMLNLTTTAHGFYAYMGLYSALVDTESRHCRGPLNRHLERLSVKYAEAKGNRMKDPPELLPHLMADFAKCLLQQLDEDRRCIFCFHHRHALIWSRFYHREMLLFTIGILHESRIPEVHGVSVCLECFVERCPDVQRGSPYAYVHKQVLLSHPATKYAATQARVNQICDSPVCFFTAHDYNGGDTRTHPLGPRASAVPITGHTGAGYYNPHRFYSKSFLKWVIENNVSV